MSYYDDWNRGPSRFSELRSALGGVVYDIRRTFLALDPATMRRLLERYGTAYGAAAAAYAGNALPKWRKGTVKLSGRTMVRLVELVPRFISPAERLALLEKLLQLHPPRLPHVWIEVDGAAPAAGLAKVDTALAKMRITDPLAHLPPKVMAAASWLYADDITAARAMIAEIDARKNEAIRSSAQREIDLLRRAVTAGQVKNASYSVTMPAGTLGVSVATKTPSLWSRILG